MANDSIDLNEIIALIARKNKILINEKDPVLAVATINDYVINHYFEKSDEALSALVSRLEEIHQSVAYEANQNAVKIINAALKSSTQLIEKNTQQCIGTLNRAVDDKVSKNIEEGVKPLKKALSISNYLLLFSAVLLVIASIIIAIKL